MWLIAIAVLASVAGFLASAVALVLLTRGTWSGKDRVWSPWGVGVLLILVAGGLLAFGGQYKLLSLLFWRVTRAEERAAAAEAQAKLEPYAQLQLTLQAPLELLWVACDGADPLAEQPRASTLCLRFHNPVGAGFTSDIAGLRLKVPGVVPPGDPRWHPLPWQTVLDGVKDPNERVRAARVSTIGDLRRFNLLEAALLVRSPSKVPAPTALSVNAGDNGSVGVFSGGLVPAAADEKGAPVPVLPLEAAGALFGSVPALPLPALAIAAADARRAAAGDWPGRKPEWTPQAVGGLVAALPANPLAGLMFWPPDSRDYVFAFHDDASIAQHVMATPQPEAVEVPADRAPGVLFGASLLLGVLLAVAGFGLTRKEE